MKFETKYNIDDVVYFINHKGSLSKGAITAVYITNRHNGTTEVLYDIDIGKDTNDANENYVFSTAEELHWYMLRLINESIQKLRD